MLSTTCLATKAPILIAPAMNTGMWTAEATQENFQVLKRRGVRFIGPEGGYLACGDTGAGRMSEPMTILNEIERLLAEEKDLAGLRVLVTAGATRERLDPVRYLTNDSSGKMGFAIAEAARDRGGEVTLVKACTTATVPEGVKIVETVSTQELFDAVTQQAGEADIIIQAAAPADFRVSEQYDQKLKKTDGKPLVITLVENPDIAAAVGKMKKPGQTLVGFAAETQNLEVNANAKFSKKNLDLIVANDVTQPGAGFNVDTNIATLISAAGSESLPIMSKRELAERILDKVIEIRSKQ